MNSILAAAKDFRQGIADSNGGGLDAFKEFPAGACGYASSLLGEYFFALGLGQWSYVSGFKKQCSQSHAWIERDGVLVDITADQFNDISVSAWVTWSRSWHKQFLALPMGKKAARLHTYDESTQQMLVAAYTRIVATISRCD